MPQKKKSKQPQVSTKQSRRMRRQMIISGIIGVIIILAMILPSVVN
jgi:archaellum biogenesis protein FlaJ (TadC family)